MKRTNNFYLLTVAALLSFTPPALACTCMDDVDIPAAPTTEQQRKMSTEEKRADNKRREAELVARRIAKAEVVVRGKVVSVRAGEDVLMPYGPASLSGAASSTITSARAVSADFKVVATIKGKTAERIKLYTGFGTGDCGIASGFFVAVAWDREISFAVQPISGVPDAYAVNMCGYAEMHDPKLPQ